MYKVRELKAILRDNNLTVSGTKEALIERLMQHHQSDKPKMVPGKLKVFFFILEAIFPFLQHASCIFEFFVQSG